MTNVPTGSARGRSRVTIADVARHAGVSVGTVSRVINGAENCGVDVRVRVRDAIDALGYVPNHYARSLKRQLTMQIALVVPDLANPVYTQMAVGVQREAAAAGYYLTLVNSGGDWSEERLAMQSLEERQVDGVILCSLQITPSLVKMVASHAGSMSVIGGIPWDCPVDNVRLDSQRGAEIAVEHLLDRGRTAIAFINGTTRTMPHDARARGYRQALERAGIEYRADLVVNADFTMVSGYEAFGILRERGVAFDGLYCANDAMALGALRHVQEIGITVPEGLALVGMDDIEAARMSTPTLTTVSLLAQERGRIACELLLRRLSGDAPKEPQKVTVVPRLIRRESSVSA